MSTKTMTKKEMAQALMNELGWHDSDALWTFENQFKTRADLAYILMVASKGKYNAEY